jgi:hypothetical protein
MYVMNASHLAASAALGVQRLAIRIGVIAVSMFVALVGFMELCGLLFKIVEALFGKGFISGLLGLVSLAASALVAVGIVALGARIGRSIAARHGLTAPAAPVAPQATAVVTSVPSAPRPVLVRRHG